MQSGKLRYLVAVEQQTSARDGFGAEQATWTNVANIYAGFEALSGNELYAAQKLNAEITTRILTRYRAGILPQMRVNWTDTRENRNRIFDILVPLDLDGRRQELQLLAVERYISALPAGPATGTPAGWGRKNFNEAPDGARLVFTLPGIPNASVLQVFVGGQMQGPAQYTLSGNTVTFAFAPGALDEMFAWY